MKHRYDTIRLPPDQSISIVWLSKNLYDDSQSTAAMKHAGRYNRAATDISTTHLCSVGHCESVTRQTAALSL